MCKMMVQRLLHRGNYFADHSEARERRRSALMTNRARMPSCTTSFSMQAPLLLMPEGCSKTAEVLRRVVDL